MVTAEALAGALTPAFVEVVCPGAERPVLALELVEPGSAVVVDRADLVLAVGARDAEDVLDLLERVGATAGVVVRRSLARLPQVRERCLDLGLTLLAVAEEAAWSAVLNLLQSGLDQAASRRADNGTADHAYSDLFEMADTISAIIDAPVTIEDARSRVLAYSSGQDDVDHARMSTIVGRQVPRQVRDHFRALGVFRRLARSDEAFFVPAGEGDVKPRFVIPVRVAGEWLGSVWAVVDRPVPEARARELRAATEVIALYLLRLRAHSELHRQLQLDQVRTALRGAASERPAWLETGPWRVAALAGPADELSVRARCELWSALGRRHGWRQPLVADLDESAYVVLRARGREPGTWEWLAELVRRESRVDATLRCAGGGPVDTVTELAESCRQAAELLRLGPATPGCPVTSIDDAWPEVVLARAVNGLGAAPLLSPVVRLMEHDRQHGGSLVDTLEAVIDHWGEPQRAARALAVHPNTVRYRTARLAEWCPVDLHDPAQRLAVRLEIARLRAEH